MTRQLGAQPDAGKLFDTLLKRKEPTNHPNGISSMLFYLATVIIHDLFRTDHTDRAISSTSSYLDLAPLYGSNQKEQDLMRTRRDGKIHPDSFSEKRVHGFPPGVSVLLIMFNRFHNYVVENLAAINENNRFDPNSSSYDEDLFQTGRLIVCGLYVNIILSDYIRTIVNLIQTKNTWRIDPRGEIKGGPPRGVGNQVSAEFNLIYRWHAAVSDRDAKWIEKTFAKFTGGKSPADLTIPEMLKQLVKMDKELPDRPDEQPLLDFDANPIMRDKETGKFDDDALVKILTESIEDRANAFGAKQIPEALRVIEIMGIEQAREWQMCTLNEFRKYFNLTQYKSFKDINPDPDIADALENLYDTPDQVELYPGLLSEATKKRMSPGSGLMPGFTISRGILSDAIALIRGDRFYTTDYTPKALTNWGYTEADSDSSVDYGHCFFKLFFTAFPKHFKRNSVYAHFPLIVPTKMHDILRRLENHENYSYERPERQPRLFEVNTWDGVMHILDRPHTFGVAWREAITFLMGNPARNFMLAGDHPPNAESRTIIESAMFGKPPNKPFDWQQEVKIFYLGKTRDLLKRKQYKLAGKNQVDLIRDVTNIVSVYFAAEMFLLPLKSNEHPRGIFTEQQLYLIFVAVFVCVFIDGDPQSSFQIHNQAREAAKGLGQIIEDNVRSLKFSGVFSKPMQAWHDRKESSPLNHYGHAMIERLLAQHKPVHELVWGHVLGTAGGMVPNQGQQFAALLDFYLHTAEGQKHWPDIVRLAQKDPNGTDPHNEEKMLRYMMEGSRLSCPSAVTRTVTPESIELKTEYMDNPPNLTDTSTTLSEGERIFVNLYTASRDPHHYIDPNAVSLERDLDRDYVCFGWGRHQCMGLPIIKTSLTAMLRVVASLPNLRAADGPQGEIKTVPAGLGQAPGTAKHYKKYLMNRYDKYWPFPYGLKVVWDDDDDAGDVPSATSKSGVVEQANGMTHGHINKVNGVATNGQANGNSHAANGAPFDLDTEMTDEDLEVVPSDTAPTNGETRAVKRRRVMR